MDGAPLGTPISSLRGAAVVQRPVPPPIELDDEFFEEEEEEEDDDDELAEELGSIKWVAKSLRRMAWFTTRMTVVKPLATAAPVARLVAILTLEHLACWLPEHVVSDIAVAAGSLAAKSASLLTESEEGQRASTAAEKFLRQFLDCASSAEGEALVYESSEAAAKLARALRSPQAIEFYDALERSAHASLDLAASKEASQLIVDGRRALDAVLDLLASDRSITALNEAAVSVATAFHARRRHLARNSTEDFNVATAGSATQRRRTTSQRIPEPTAENLDETLSECGSDEDEFIAGINENKPPSSIPSFVRRRGITRPLQKKDRNKTRNKTKKSSEPCNRKVFTDCVFISLLLWSVLSFIIIVTLFYSKHETPPSSTLRFDLSASHLHENDLAFSNSGPSSPSTILYKVNAVPVDAPRPLKSFSYENTDSYDFTTFLDNTKDTTTQGQEQDF